MAAASHATLASDRRLIVGLGSASLDILAYVDGFPLADSKVRTTHVTRCGGGNCANTLVALARLSHPTQIVTKIGGDEIGAEIKRSLCTEGAVVGSRWLLCDPPTSPAAFTYVIVDTRNGTRTCIHTPSLSELAPTEMDAAMVSSAVLLHLDSRHTAAAAQLAQLARKRGVPVSLDVEKARPGLTALFPMVDILVTNTSFPREHTGVVNDNPAVALATMLTKHCVAAWVAVSTLGERGCVAVVRTASVPAAVTAGTATEIIVDGVSFQSLVCPASAVHSVVDTTGAGDVFIAGFLSAIVRAWSVSEALIFGSRCAAWKIEREGARAGPTLADLAARYPDTALYVAT